jgi:hypothetical protein
LDRFSLSSSTRANNPAISVSFSTLDREEESKGGVIQRLTHASSHGARKIYSQPDRDHPPAINRPTGVSNYPVLFERAGGESKEAGGLRRAKKARWPFSSSVLRA